MIYERVMVFGAHPDDEGTMARTIAKLSAAGTKVTTVIMTNGCEGYPSLEMKDTIVATRTAEAAHCDRVLGIAHRVIMDIPDMGLTNDKQTLQEVIRLIREDRPDAVFTHGPDDPHRDHVAVHHITRSACFHAAEPVAIALGNPWKPRFVYYHKGVQSTLTRVIVDVTEFRCKRLEAAMTQESQYSVFRRTKEDFEKEIAAVRASDKRCYDTFWLAEWMRLGDLLPTNIAAPSNYHGER